MKLGVLLDNLGPTQLAYYLIRNANALLAAEPLSDVLAFYEHLVKPCAPPHFATMQTSEVWGFDGVAVATSFATAQLLLHCPTPSKKLFYVWDIEWLRMKQKSYEGLAAVYRNPDLHLVARSGQHADLLARCWNREILCVMEDFDLTRLREVL